MGKVASYQRLKKQLDDEFNLYKSLFRDIADYIRPFNAQFQTRDGKKGTKKNHKIIDSTSLFAVRTGESGMMGGITSPARPWFKLSVTERNMMDNPAVKNWLARVEQLMSDTFIKSNLYNVLPTMYGDILSFGIGAIYMEEDMDNVIRFINYPIGSYKIGNDENLKPRVFVREFQLTVRQIVHKFCEKKNGKFVQGNVSDSIWSMYKEKQYETWVDVVHCIKPNEHFKEGSPLSKNKKYISVYYENGKDNSKFLREKGYEFFPVLVPRWQVTGEDVYPSSCPGMIALGDVKQLQLGEQKSMQAIEKIINPPLSAPIELENKTVSLIPGDITFLKNQQGLKPIHEVRFDLNSMESKNAQVRERINKAFFVDLFLMLANSDRRQITATEIQERQQEKLLALGPVLEQLNQDLLDPLIDNTFTILARREELPEIPEELEGTELKVEYVSIMAQAQKSSGISSVQNFLGFVNNMGQVDPGVLKKVKTYDAVDVMHRLTGAPESIIRSNDEVEEMDKAEAQAKAQQAAAEEERRGLETAKELSQIPIGESTALEQLSNAGAVANG